MMSILCVGEMKRILDYIDGKGASDEYTKQLEEAVRSARQNERWRLDYMTLQMNYQEKYEQGIEQGNKQAALRMIEAGKLSYEDMVSQLEIAIHQFAKRQMTWFRGMERRGFTIHWVNASLPMEEKINFVKQKLKEF